MEIISASAPWFEYPEQAVAERASATEIKRSTCDYLRGGEESVRRDDRSLERRALSDDVRRELTAERRAHATRAAAPRSDRAGRRAARARTTLTRPTTVRMPRADGQEFERQEQVNVGRPR